MIVNIFTTSSVSYTKQVVKRYETTSKVLNIVIIFEPFYVISVKFMHRIDRQEKYVKFRAKLSFFY
jgi:hypothetical protein